LIMREDDVLGVIEK